MWTFYYSDNGNVNNEIDIEFFGTGSGNASVIYSSWTSETIMHNEKSTLNYEIADNNFHTYRFDWYTATTAAKTSDSRPRVEYYIDGVKVFTIYNTNTKTVVPDHEMKLWIGAWCPTWAGSNVNGTYYMYVSDITYVSF